jgi:hypothetical protein
MLQGDAMRSFALLSSPRTPSRLKLILLSMGLLLLAGCVDEHRDGETLTYTYAWWTVVLTAVGGLACFPLAWWQWESSKWRTVVLSLVGLGILGGIVPMFLFGKAIINPREMHVSGGFIQKPQHVPLAELKVIRLTKEESTGRRGTRTSYYIECELRSGKVEKLALGNNLVQEAGVHLLNHAKERGIPILNLSGVKPDE